MKGRKERERGREKGGQATSQGSKGEREVWIASVCIDRRPTQELEPLWYRYRKKDEMGPGEKFANKKPEVSGKEGMQNVNCGNAFWKGL